MSKELGLSGCKLEIISGSRIRKYSSNKDYNYRLLEQPEEQIFIIHRVDYDYNGPIRKHMREI